jgi:type IV pilus assembly protein PilE
MRMTINTPAPGLRRGKSVATTAPGATHRRRGFSAIDMTVALLMMGLLAATAIPSYREQVRKGRRIDAIAALSALQLAQERHRSTAPRYADDPAQLGRSAWSDNGYYTLSILGASGTGYTLVATAQPGSSQAHDGPCVQMAVSVQSGLTVLLAADASGALTEDRPRQCWPH